MQKIIAGLLASLVIALVAIVSIISTQDVKSAYGSTATMDGYVATTTSALTPMPVLNNLTSTTTSHSGILGSIIQAAAGSAGGNINIYDATTTNSALRTGQVATSSILIASLPTNATVGTYTFDAVFKVGLLVVTDGTVGTTTITWKY